MSSVELLDRTISYLRGRFDQRDVFTVQPYGGQFNADEVPAKSYVCPAIFVAVRGWEGCPDNRRLTGRHVRAVEMSAFVLTANKTRDARMASAMLLAERVALALRMWQPDEEGNTACDIAPLEDEPACENLYNRAIDRAGQALWVVHWWQAVRLRPQQQLWDLLQVEAASLARLDVPQDAAPPKKLVSVSHEINYPPQP